IVAAHVADRRRNNRLIALVGYGLSVVSRVVLLLSGGIGMLAALVALLLDRIGKGIRTAPRDAIIAGHTRREHLGAAFGVHRSMDAVGALIGPLIGAGLLWLLPFRFDWLFTISLLFGFAGIAVFRIGVTEPPVSVAETSSAGLAPPAAERPLAWLRLVVADK